jgi:hypothetical protein
VRVYNVFYLARVENQRMYGRDVLLLPGGSHPRAGVHIVMLASRTAKSQVSSPLKVGTVGILELPLGTFTIG